MAIPPLGETVCDVVAKDLPHECTCANKDGIGGNVTCTFSVLGTPFGIGLDIEPCKKPNAEIDFEAFFDTHTFDYSIKAGTKGTEAIPGLSFSIDHIIAAGAFVDYELDGNANNLRIIIGIDACADIDHVKHVCGHDVTKKLPINILNTTVSFASICK